MPGRENVIFDPLATTEFACLGGGHVRAGSFGRIVARSVGLPGEGNLERLESLRAVESRGVRESLLGASTQDRVERRLGGARLFLRGPFGGARRLQPGPGNSERRHFRY